MNELWVEKYKPKKLKDLYLPNQELSKIKLWITNFKANKPKAPNCLFLYGSPGIGKTTIAHLILKEYNYNATELNSSEYRTSKKIKDKLKDILEKKHVLNLFKQIKKETGIIMDEIDGLSLGERSSLTELIKIISPKKKDIKNKQVNFRYLKKNPFICISNSIDKKLNELKLKSVFINIPLPNKYLLRKCCVHILNNENKQYTENILDKIIDKSQFDYRRLINILEYCYSSNENINEQKIEKLLLNFDKKNIDETTYKYIDMFFNNYLDIDSALKNYNTNKNTISMLFFENFIEHILKNKKDTEEIKLDTILKIYNNFSISDGMDYNIYINQHWDLYNYNALYKCIEPSYQINKLESYKVNKSNNITFSTLLNKTSFEFLNLKTTSCFENKYLKSSESIKLYDIYNLIKNDSTNYSYNKIILDLNILKEELDKVINIYKK